MFVCTPLSPKLGPEAIRLAYRAILRPPNSATNLYFELEVSPAGLSRGLALATRAPRRLKEGALQMAPAVNIRLLPPMRF